MCFEMVIVQRPLYPSEIWIPLLAKKANGENDTSAQTSGFGIPARATRTSWFFLWMFLIPLTILI